MCSVGDVVDACAFVISGIERATKLLVSSIDHVDLVSVPLACGCLLNVGDGEALAGNVPLVAPHGECGLEGTDELCRRDNAGDESAGLVAEEIERDVDFDFFKADKIRPNN